MRLRWDAGACGAGLRSEICPAKNLQMSVGIFDKGSAAFNPVPIIGIENSADLADRGVMDMAANRAVEAARAHFARHRLLETANIFDCVLHLVFQPCRQRPIGKVETAAHGGEYVIDLERQPIGAVAKMREPARTRDDA